MSVRDVSEFPGMFSPALSIAASASLLVASPFQQVRGRPSLLSSQPGVQVPALCSAARAAPGAVSAGDAIELAGAEHSISTHRLVAS